MVSLSVLVAAGEQYMTQCALTEHDFESSVFWYHGLLLPPVAVRGDASLPSGRLVICVNGERGAVVEGPVLAHLWRTIREWGAALLDEDGTRVLLDLLHDSHPVLVDAARARFDLPFLCRRLQALLSDGIPIADLRGILEALLGVRGHQSAPPNADESSLCLSESGYDLEVRAGIRYAIVSPHVKQGWLEVHVVDEGWRAALRSPLDPADLLRLQRAVAAAVGDARNAVLLTNAETRSTLSELMRREGRELTVLAFTDLPSDLNIRELAPVA